MPKIKDSSYPQGPVLVDGYYPASLKEVKEYTRTYENGTSDRLAWVFDVEAGEDAIDENVEIMIEDFVPDGHYEMAAHTGANRSTKQTSRWKQIELDTIVPEDCTDTDEIVGSRCMVAISSYRDEKDGLVKNSIDKIRPPRAGKAKAVTGGSAKKKDAEIGVDESDFDEIPFRHPNTKARVVRDAL